MSAKVVLPDFNFPGTGPHPAIRALWVSGGLVFVATMILGGALWHRHAVDMAAQSAASRALSAAAEQSPPMPVAATAHPSAAQPALAKVAAVPAEAPEASVAPVAATASAPARHHGGGRHHHMHASKSPRGKAVAARDGRSSKNSSAKKDDAIDRMLKQFK
jgi:hypothetical protein